MTNIVQAVKENLIVSIGTLVGSIVVIFSAIFTIDARYAHSDELSKLKAEQRVVIIQNRSDLQANSAAIRKQLIEDKIFEIEIIPPNKRSPYDHARLEKYKRDLADVNQIIYTTIDISRKLSDYNNAAPEERLAKETSAMRKLEANQTK